MRGAEQSGTKAVDDGHHRIQSKGNPPLLRDDGRGVGNGRAEEPELDEQRNRHLHITEANIERREPAPDTDRGYERHQKEEWHPQDCERERWRGDGDPDERHDESRAEVDQRDSERRERYQDAREVDAGDEVMAAYDALGGGQDAEGDELPREERHERREGIGAAVSVEPAQLPEE